MTLTVHTDGGARGNPGPAAIGIVIEDTAGTKVTAGEYIGETTNNVAEYTAVEKAFLLLLKNHDKNDRGEVLFFLDSLLVVNQLSGYFKIKDQKLKSLYLKIKGSEREWGSRVSYQHIPRAKNGEADFLVNKALDKTMHP
jgi:ribonuclease HI